MRSLDLMTAEVDAEKNPLLSDRGESIKRMVRIVDNDWQVAAEVRLSETEQRDRIAAAVERLVVIGKKRLIPVLLLIIANGKNRKISLKKCSRRTYFRARGELMKIFEG